jgi:MOSC domain-containing protein YiiM
VSAHPRRLALDPSGRVTSVRTGRVQVLRRPDWDHHEERTWTTAFLKEEVPGAVHVGPLGLAGDQQADARHHGGPHMAVLAYSADHYAAWRAELGLPEMGHGGFGENLSITGFDESNTCIGDVLGIGDTLQLEVASPRAPCAHISRRWNREDLLKRVVETSRTGWYLRVRREGDVRIGDPVSLVSRVHPGWTVRRVGEARHAKSLAPADAAWLAACPELAPEWRERFEARATGA